VFVKKVVAFFEKFCNQRILLYKTVSVVKILIGAPPQTPGYLKTRFIKKGGGSHPKSRCDHQRPRLYRICILINF
jgi:hypothetical protein